QPSDPRGAAAADPIVEHVQAQLDADPAGEVGIAILIAGRIAVPARALQRTPGFGAGANRPPLELAAVRRRALAREETLDERPQAVARVEGAIILAGERAPSRGHEAPRQVGAGDAAQVCAVALFVTVDVVVPTRCAGEARGQRR